MPPRDDGIGDVGDSAQGDGETTNASEPGSGPATVTGDPGVSTGSGEPDTGEPPDADATSETTTSATSRGGSSGSSPPSACLEYSVTIDGCQGETAAAMFLDSCESTWASYAAYSYACVVAYEDWLVCLSTLSCAQLEAVLGCDPEFDAFDDLCPKLP